MARLGSTSTPQTRIDPMSNTARDPVDHPIDPPDEDDAARDRRFYIDEMTRMQAEVDVTSRDLTSAQAIIAEMETTRARQNWRLLAERTARPAEVWLPLTFAAIDLVGTELKDYERVRKWCELRKIVCKQDDPPHWLVEMNSARAYAASKGMVPPSAKPKLFKTFLLRSPG
jgi:hypothetical protein